MVHTTYQDYDVFQWNAFLLQTKPWNGHSKSEPAHSDAFLGGRCHAIPPNACFTAHSYMTGIWLVYACHITSAGLFLVSWTLPSQLLASGPAGSSKRAGTFQIWNVWGPFQFRRQKFHQHEAGACQSSTARCWSHTHGCPCAIPGSRCQHTRIRRPASGIYLVYTRYDIIGPNSNVTGTELAHKVWSGYIYICVCVCVCHMTQIVIWQISITHIPVIWQVYNK